MADLLAIELWRLQVIGISFPDGKQTGNTYIVHFKIFDQTGSPSAAVAQQLQTMVENQDPALEEAGITAVGIQVNTDNAAGHGGKSSDDTTSAILIGVLVPVGFLLLLSVVLGGYVFSKRFKRDSSSEEDPDPTLGAPTRAIEMSDTIGVPSSLPEPRLRPMKKESTRYSIKKQSTAHSMQKQSTGYDVSGTTRKRNDRVIAQYSTEVRPQLEQKDIESGSSDEERSASSSEASSSESESSTHSTDDMSTPSSVSSYASDTPKFEPLAKKSSK
jgi:hypothetical protein